MTRGEFLRKALGGILGAGVAGVVASELSPPAPTVTAGRAEIWFDEAGTIGDLQIWFDEAGTIGDLQSALAEVEEWQVWRPHKAIALSA